MPQFHCYNFKGKVEGSHLLVILLIALNPNITSCKLSVLRPEYAGCLISPLLSLLSGLNDNNLLDYSHVIHEFTV